MALDETTKLGEGDVGAVLDSSATAAEFIDGLRQLGVTIEYPTLY